ncbi:hypothetical protein AVEN_102117-1 [Araneus ventricosus]|uniref:Uncharacterized protein n=1 Tax=Araneus ventricosus TaxID=182803 RepID=A0A4Y2FIE6_ARAVE|nr:hypothetical protein AVEN_102117-1 [Araneus ventricosus]
MHISQLSEEITKARNKCFRLYRSNCPRKFNREVFNIDVLNMFLLSSDSFMIWAGQRPCEIFCSSETLQSFQETSEDGPSIKHQNQNDENEELSSKE